MLKVQNVGIRFGDACIIKDLSLELEEGQWLMLVGPNGAGKSTLISAISQIIPYSGTITLDGKDIKTFRPAQLARQLGVLAQHNNVGYDYTVEEVVELGRYAHSGGFFAGSDEKAENFIDKAIELAGLSQLRGHSVLTLSGGELQRTFLAQVLAQDPKLLILDEPANHLDLIYQKHIFSLISEWLKQPGRAVLSVVHDLNLALRFGTHAVLMRHGETVAQGPIHDVLTRENLKNVYDMDVYEWMREMLSQWN